MDVDFGSVWLTSKFSECMLAIKYREINAKGEMVAVLCIRMKKGLKNKTFGAVLAWLFALFAVIASFGIGNMTRGNSIAELYILPLACRHG